MKPEEFGLFEAIYRGDSAGFKDAIDKLKGSALREVLNYQLTKADLKQAEVEFGQNPRGYEEGMTLLMMALSLERLEIAELIGVYADIIDYDKKNAAGITHLHLLLMCGFGDKRYDKDCQQTDIKEPGTDFDKRIEDITARIFGFTNSFVDEDRNLISEAVFHQNLDIAERLLYLTPERAPRPEDYTDIKASIRQYNTPIKALAAFTKLKGLFGTKSKIRGYHFKFYQDSPPPLLTDVAEIKEVVCHFKQHEPTAETIELIQSLLSYMQENGQKVSAQDFQGFLDDFAMDAPDEIKALLLDEHRFNAGPT
jgi:hypothetical protein